MRNVVDFLEKRAMRNGKLLSASSPYICAAWLASVAGAGEQGLGRAVQRLRPALPDEDERAPLHPPAPVAGDYTNTELWVVVVVYVAQKIHARGDALSFSPSSSSPFSSLKAVDKRGCDAMRCPGQDLPQPARPGGGGGGDAALPGEVEGGDPEGADTTCDGEGIY